MRFKKSPKHYVFVSLITLLLLVIVAIVLLPIALHLFVQSWLKEQGLKAEIDFVGFHLNKGIFLVENARGTNEFNRGFSIDKFLVEVNWRPLLNKQLDIQRVEIDGLTLDIVKKEKSLKVAGLELDKLSQQKTSQDARQTKQSPQPIDWSVKVQQVTLTDIKVCQHMEARQGSALTIDKLMHACATLDSLTWRGNLGWAPAVKDKSAASGFTINGNLLSGNFVLANHERSQIYMAWDNVNFNLLDVNGTDRLSMESVQLNNVNLLQHSNAEKSPYLVGWKDLFIISPTADLQKQRFSVDAVRLTGFNANIENTKSGITGLPVMEKQKRPQTNHSEKHTTKTQKTKPAYSFAVKKLTIDGDSTVAFKDKLVDPVFSEKFSAIKLSIIDVDSAQPAVKSKVSASLKVSDYGEVDINGTVQPFAERLSLDLKQVIKHIDLANYNVYAKSLIGYRIRSGDFNLEQKLTIKDGYLDTESKLILNKFKVKTLESEEAEKYKSDLGIPLSTALSLLRDKDDNIKLTIPVTGDINDPDFSLRDVISTVTSKAIKEAIITYYTPFGLVKILGGIADLATGLNFEPVVFAAGDTKLDQSAIEHVTKLSKLLKERPQVQLTFCGHPVTADILKKYQAEQLLTEEKEGKQVYKLTEKQKSELLAFLKARMDKIKKYMVNQLKVDPGQLLLCSEPDNKDWEAGIDSKPDIKISI